MLWKLPTVAEEDESVRYLRAARELVVDPERLETLLCHLLDAAPATADGPGVLALDDGAGPGVRLRRGTPFTDADWARAAELHRLAMALRVPAAGSTPGTVLDGVAAKDLLVRRGIAADAAAVLDLHRRCSAETISRRYLSAGFSPSLRQARALLQPGEGFSFVVTGGAAAPDVVVGVACCSGSAGGAEAAVLVEDGWQRRGLGTRLLQAVAREAASQGLAELTLISRADNRGVFATLHRTGLRARISRVDGLSRYTVSLRGIRSAAERTSGRTGSSDSRSLVGLLHRRAELRSVLAAADVLDAALRDGA